MPKKTTVAIAHSDSDLGKPAEYTRAQLSLVKDMIRQIADQTMGGMHNIVRTGDKVLIKINTVIPVAANAASWHAKNTLFKDAAIVRSYSSSVTSSAIELPVHPALLTRMSIRPNAAFA